MFQMVYEEGAAASEAGPSEEARRAAARCEARRYSRPGNGIRQDDRYAGSDQMQYKNRNLILKVMRKKKVLKKYL